MEKTIRILTSEGEIIKSLLTGEKTTSKLLESVRIAKPTMYSALKDLQLSGLIQRDGIEVKISSEGIKMYFSEVLPGVDVGALLVFSRAVGIDPLRFVGLGVRLLNALVNAAYLPGDLVRLLGHNDPALLEVLTDIFGRRDGGDMAQAAEVVA